MDAFWVMAFATALGACAQAATGFGFALVAAPLFLAAYESMSAIQILLIISLVQSLIVVPKLFRHAPPGFLKPLVVGSLIGFPLGLATYLALNLVTLKVVVACGMLGFSALLVARELGWLQTTAASGAPPVRSAVVPPGWVIGAAGTAAGALTAVLVSPGPPLIVMNGWLRLRKEESRALTLTFFAFCYVMALVMHAIWGGIALETWTLALWMAPFCILGTVVGSRIAGVMSEQNFRWAVLAVAVASGGYALLDVVL